MEMPCINEKDCDFQETPISNDYSRSPTKLTSLFMRITLFAILATPMWNGMTRSPTPLFGQAKGTWQWKSIQGLMEFCVVFFKWTFNFMCEIFEFSAILAPLIWMT